MKISTIAATAPAERCPSCVVADVAESEPFPPSVELELELVKPASRVLELAAGVPLEGTPVDGLAALATGPKEEEEGSLFPLPELPGFDDKLEVVGIPPATFANKDPAEGEGEPTLPEGNVPSAIVGEPPPVPPDGGATPEPPDGGATPEPLEPLPVPVPLEVVPPVLATLVLPTLLGLPPFPFPLPLPFPFPFPFPVEGGVAWAGGAFVVPAGLESFFCLPTSEEMRATEGRGRRGLSWGSRA